MPSFDRHAAILETTSLLQRYLSSAAVWERSDHDIDALLGLPRGDFSRLLATHILSSPGTVCAVDECERLARELPSAVVREKVEARGQVRGPVDWATTSRRRMAEGDPTVFVCLPPSRGYDSPLARLVRTTLARVAHLATIAELEDRGAVGGASNALARRAALLLERSPKLSLVPSKAPPGGRTLSSLQRRGVAPESIAFDRMWREAYVERDPIVLADVMGRRVLAPASDDSLFEWLVGARIVATLELAGLQRLRGGLISGETPMAVFRHSSGAKMRIWRQRSVWKAIRATPESSLYSRVLEAAGLSRSRMRPDFLVECEESNALLMVEVKLTSDEELSPDRLGLREAMGYVHDCENELAGRPAPWALVVAWNSQAMPRANADGIMMCGPEGLDTAVQNLLEAWLPSYQLRTR